jgi:tripartite-type tricarboxylate transporter receptor subunit TctC
MTQETPRMLDATRALAASLVLYLGVAAPAAAQDDPAAFFKGKQLKILVGSAAGSGYDINARVLARHWANHIPGKPSIIIQNMPGAGSVAMANQVYAAGARDGTVIGAPINGVTTAPLLMPEIVKYDLAKLIWIGSTNSDTQITYVWHDAPVKAMNDLLTAEIVVGATSAGTTHVDYPAVANTLFGTRFKIVSGYRSTGAVHLAM